MAPSPKKLSGHRCSPRNRFGTAVSAAIAGLRPVCEMQFADFVAWGFDQLVNVAGRSITGSGSPCP